MARIFYQGYSRRPYVSEKRNDYVGVIRWESGINIPEKVTTVKEAREIKDKFKDYPDLVSVTFENRPDWINVPECSYCAARPVTGEYDCDGFHWNVTCDSPQCKQGDIRRGRKNISASNRARGL